MLNLFINSTTYGQVMGATFNMDAEGSLAERRITQSIDVEAPVYEKVVDSAKITQLITTGQTDKVSKMGKAIEAETIRVNSLAMLFRELQLISSLESNDMIVAYLPAQLLQEVESGRVKFYLDGTTETAYYSEYELNLWRQVLPLIQSMYCRIVFKNIASCKNNHSNTQIQADRCAIYANMYQKLLTAYRDMKALKSGNVQSPTVSNEAIF